MRPKPNLDLSSWIKLADKEKAHFKPHALNYEDIDLKPIYTSQDLPDNYESLPGFFPYTRGIKASMYQSRPWTIRQYAGFANAKASNAFYKQALASGQKGLSIAFDLPTHRGYDSDHPLAIGDVGKAGVAIDSIMDMRDLFAGIDLKEVSVSMTMNGAVLPILAAFIVVAKEQGLALKEIKGTIQNDILKEFMVRNTFIYPPKPSLRIVADVIEYCSTYLPKFNAISISGYHMHEAGANASLELGLTLANGLTYVDTMKSRGLDLDSFVPRLSFFFATGMNFFMEIAKLRAARKLWAEMMKDRGCLNEASLYLRVHCQTSGFSLTAQDPYNNIVRTTLEALASVLGGTQSLHTNSFDEALALPSELAARIARNTQLILQHETKICDVVDPLGGSYYIEYLTDKLMLKAREIITKINDYGGMIKAIQDHLPQKWIEEASLRKQALIDAGQEIRLGVNAFIPPYEDKIDILAIDNIALLKEQQAKLAYLKNHRDEAELNQALKNLNDAAYHDGNLLAYSIKAIEAKATIGEISDTLAKVFARYEPTMSPLKGIYALAYPHQDELKDLKTSVDNLALHLGRRPRILIAKLGQDGHDRGAKIIASSLADFGFDVDIAPLFQTPSQIAQDAIDHDVHVIGISSLAGGHNILIPKLLDELTHHNAKHILVIAGGIIPPKDQEVLLSKGVALIFGAGSNIITATKSLVKLLMKHHEISQF